MRPFRQQLALACVLMLTAATQQVRAAQYEIPISQLAGVTTSGDFFPLEISLGEAFQEIDAATVRITGTHTPGAFGDLNEPGQFPLPADIYGSFLGETSEEGAFVEEILSTSGGQFTYEQTFRTGFFADEGPDYSGWLDGTAEFQLSVFSPPLIGTTYVSSSPLVNIESASLLIEGRSTLDSLASGGDINQDGEVDGQDLLAIQRGEPAMIAQWRGDYGTVNSLPAALAVPEPSALLLLAVGLAMVAARRRTSAA